MGNGKGGTRPTGSGRVNTKKITKQHKKKQKKGGKKEMSSINAGLVEGHHYYTHTYLGWRDGGERKSDKR